MLKREKTFIIFAAIASLIAAGIYMIYTHHADDSGAVPSLSQLLPHAPPGSGTSIPARVSSANPKDKAAIYKSYDVAADENAKLNALLDLLPAIRQSKALTDEDRSLFEKYFKDKDATIDGKKHIVICIHEMKDVKSVPWLLDDASKEEDQSFKRVIVLALTYIDRKATASLVADRMATDKSYASIKTILDSMSNGQ
jgi:hypothetical protein